MEEPLILIVEDETTLVETLQYSLIRQGYRVVIAMNGQIGIEQARKYKPDLIILDVMLPILDGFEVCRVLRQEMSVPILMLTARVDEVDKVVGLEVGADDYLTKPFSVRELIARVKAQLRRVRLIREDVNTQKEPTTKEINPSIGRLIFANLVIDTNRHEVLLDDYVVHLKPKEYECLLFFVNHNQRVLTRKLV